MVRPTPKPVWTSHYSPFQRKHPLAKRRNRLKVIFITPLSSHSRHEISKTSPLTVSNYQRAPNLKWRNQRSHQKSHTRTLSTSYNRLGMLRVWLTRKCRLWSRISWSPKKIWELLIKRKTAKNEWWKYKFSKSCIKN